MGGSKGSPFRGKQGLGNGKASRNKKLNKGKGKAKADSGSGQPSKRSQRSGWGLIGLLGSLGAAAAGLLLFQRWVGGWGGGSSTVLMVPARAPLPRQRLMMPNHHECRQYQEIRNTDAPTLRRSKEQERHQQDKSELKRLLARPLQYTDHGYCRMDCRYDTRRLPAFAHEPPSHAPSIQADAQNAAAAVAVLHHQFINLECCASAHLARVTIDRLCTYSRCCRRYTCHCLRRLSFIPTRACCSLTLHHERSQSDSSPKPRSWRCSCQAGSTTGNPT